MPIRTRAEMHIGLDLILNVLNATPSNRLDPPVRDYFLNRTISEFVKNEIAKANKPDESKRIPFRILTSGDISTKYNNLYTLIKIDDNLLPIYPTIDNNFYQYILPTDLFRFETSFANVRPLDHITYPSASKPTLINSSGGTVDAGIHNYFVTFVYPTVETDITGENVATITVGASNNIELSNIPLGLTGCTARKIYRNKLNTPWHKAYYVGTVSGNSTQIYTDSATDASLTILYTGNIYDTQLTNPLLDTNDIISFNNNPYGGKRKYIGTILETNSILLSGYLRLYHLNRYAINKVGVIYIKKPAILTSSPSIIDCDLPGSVHDVIVEDTAKFISAAVNSGNYQQLLMEAKQQS